MYEFYIFRRSHTEYKAMIDAMAELNYSANDVDKVFSYMFCINGVTGKENSLFASLRDQHQLDDIQLFFFSNNPDDKNLASVRFKIIQK